MAFGLLKVKGVCRFLDWGSVCFKEGCCQYLELVGGPARGKEVLVLDRTKRSLC